MTASSCIKVQITGYRHGNGVFTYYDNGNRADHARALGHAHSYVRMFNTEFDMNKVTMAIVQ